MIELLGLRGNAQVSHQLSQATLRCNGKHLSCPSNLNIMPHTLRRSDVKSDDLIAAKAGMA